jgi:hypothetical protein
MKHGILATSSGEVGNIESWLGAQLDLVSTTYSQNAQQTAFDNGNVAGVSPITWSDSAKAGSLKRTFGDTDRQLVLSYELAGTDAHGGGDYSGAATGAWDAQYRGMAQELVRLGMGDTIIRPNHEFNLSWNSKYPNNPSNYRDAYARCVREMQSVSGANFRFLFSPARRRLGVAPDAWPPDSPYWPSGEPVPWVVTSNYDKSGIYDDGTTDEPTQTERENVWQNEVLENITLWTDFAEKRGGKYGGSPEWGCVEHPDDKTGLKGGGDNAWFVQKYIEYGEANGFVLQTWWNGDNHLIYPRSQSKLTDASDKFRELMADRLSSSSSDSTSDSTSDDYGGYAQPAEGTLDWHVPVNENFQRIEEDVLKLHERISNLENK